MSGLLCCFGRGGEPLQDHVPPQQQQPIQPQQQQPQQQQQQQQAVVKQAVVSDGTPLQVGNPDTPSSSEPAHSGSTHPGQVKLQEQPQQAHVAATAMAAPLLAGTNATLARTSQDSTARPSPGHQQQQQGAGTAALQQQVPLPPLPAPAVQPAGFKVMSGSELAKEVHQLTWIGHGGYGAVYKGVWQGASVAVKFTVADYVDLDGVNAHEAVLSKILSHPNVVQTFASRVSCLDETFLRQVFETTPGATSGSFGHGQAGHAGWRPDNFRSGEGFGSPYGDNTSINFRDVVTHVGARPGMFMTQMIMEYCDRGSLHQAIAKGLFKTSSKWNNKIALRAMLRTAREIAQGMSHLHMCRVVHGDLKPGNVLLMSSRADRRGFIAKVSDFGLSTYCMTSHISVSRWSTVSYMAPEAFDGHLTMKSDVYSFGIMLWEMYTGKQPHAGVQPAEVVLRVQEGRMRLEWPDDSDPRIVDIVLACIQRDAERRPTFLELINLLTSLEAQIRVETPMSRDGDDRLLGMTGMEGRHM